MTTFYILLLFSAIAFLYASVGHGGASGYIALMVIFAFPQHEIKTNALFLNLFVSLMSFSQYFKKETFPYRLFLLLVLFSIPMAFLGGGWTLHHHLYKKLLGLILLIPIIKFFGGFSRYTFHIKPTIALLMIMGISIGLLSGLLGIGGGIILSPLLLLLGWADIKQTSAVSALFIFLNSLAGLLGQGISQISLSSNIHQILLFTVLGGILGGYFGARKFKLQWIKYTLAFVLLIACFKLFTT